MGKIKDLTGKKFGRLLVKNFNGKDKNGHIYNCVCDCGKTTMVHGVRLRNGRTQSCGCLNIEKVIKSNTKHSLSNHPLYKIRCGIIERCTKVENHAYKNYGGRGIKICPEWENSFVVFYEWAMENGYKKGLHIDRIDNNGDYTPDNCHFVEPKDNIAVGKRRKFDNNTSGYTGVYWDKNAEKWKASINVNKEFIYLGIFSNIQDALQARINKEIEIFGHQKTNVDNE